MTTKAAPTPTRAAVAARPDGSPAPDDHPSLTAALAAAQAEFPKIEKTLTATVTPKGGGASYSYSYADLGDVLAAVRPVLAKHGLALIQRTEPIQGGSKTLLTTELRWGNTFTADGQPVAESIESRVEIQASTAQPQQFGGSLTYLRRYELVTLLGIAAEEDRDAQDVEPPNGNGRGVEVPAFALAAHPNRRKELAAALEPLLGARSAEATIATVEENLGKLPDGMVAMGKLVAAKFAAALEATGQLDPYRRELSSLLAEREQERARAAQETQAQAASGEPEEAQAPLPEHEQPPGDLPPVGGVPAVGTVDPPEQEEGETFDDLEQRFRDAGCVCKHPLAEKDQPGAHDDHCPIKGHGIPF